MVTIMGVPDMSGSRVKHEVPEPAARPRRTVSVYDKMQEARERRAALLNATEPANLPRQATAALPTSSPNSPEQEPAPTSSRFPEIPPASPEVLEVPSRSAGTKWTIRALVILLAVLVGIAVHMASTERIGPGPEITPPVASLSQPAMGQEIPIPAGPGADPAIAATTAPLAPPRVILPEHPRAGLGETRPKGPVIADSVDLPVMPAVSASALVVLPNEVLPPERPDFRATGQSGG